MKWAFYLLLAVNIAMFAWQQMQEPETEPVPGAGAKAQFGDKSIRLLHEIDNDAKSMADIMESGNGKARRAPEPRKPVAVVEPERVAAPEDTAPLTEPPELSEIEREVAASAANARHAQRIEAAMAARETEPRAAPAERRAEPPAQPAREEPVTEKRVCYAAGPIASKGNAEAVQARMENLGIVARQRSEEIAGKTEYWVLEVTRDERAAQKRLAELRKKNVNDAEIVFEGDYQNMVSLGRYAQEREATARVNKLVKLGFRPVVEKNQSITTQYWIDFEETGRRALSSAQWQEVTAGVGRIDKKERACR